MEKEKSLFGKATNLIKRVFKDLFYLFIIAGFIGSFYAGMQTTANYQSSENPKALFFSAIDNALKSTEDQPVVVILPEISLIEKAMFWRDTFDHREVIYMTSRDSTLILTGQCDPEEATTTEKVWASARDGVYNAYDWISKKVK